MLPSTAAASPGLADLRPRRLRLRDADGLQPPLLEQTRGLLVVVLGQVLRVHTLGQVPPAMSAFAADDGDHALPQRKSSMCGTWFLPYQPSGARSTCAVSGISLASSGPSALSRARTSCGSSSFASSHCLAALAPRPFPHRGKHERQQAHRAERAVELEEQPVELDRLLQLAGLVRPADPRPQHGVLARGDRRGRVDLDVAELLGDLDDVARPLCVQQLRAHGDAAGLVASELVRHSPRLSTAWRREPHARTSAQPDLRTSTPRTPCRRPSEGRR